MTPGDAGKSKATLPKEEHLQLKDLMSIPSTLFFALSWQKDRIAFYWDRTGRNELWVMSLDDRVPRQLSHGEVPRAIRIGFLWNRAGTTIIFGKDKDGNEQHHLYQIDTATGRVTQLTDEPTSQKYPLEFASDDRLLLVSTNRKGKGGRKQHNLWTLDVKERKWEQLTDFANPVLAEGQRNLWSPDCKRIAFTANESSDLKNTDIYVMDANGSNVRRIFRTKEGSQDSVAAWSPDGKSLAITSDTFGSERPGILNIETGEVQWLGKLGVDESAVDYSPNGKYLISFRHASVAGKLILYDIKSGRTIEPKIGDGVTMDGTFLADDRSLVCLHSSPTCPWELRLYDMGAKKAEKLTHNPVNEGLTNRLADCETIAYESFDRLKIEALLYKPRSAAQGKRFPALVEVHGGPTGQYYRVFNPFTQYLANQGYVILQPNIRGSTGYGVKFRDMALKDWGGADLDDVASGAKFLRSLPYVDPDRVGVWGGSYGGFMTFMAVTKRPELWKTAVAWVGITDLHAMYEKSNELFRFFMREQMGDPVKDADLWNDRSAIYFADKVQTKLLMVHGANDPRCPVEQSRAFRDRLKELGKKEGEDYEYFEFSDEGHGSSDIAQKIRVTEILANYLNRNL